MRGSCVWISGRVDGALSQKPLTLLALTPRRRSRSIIDLVDGLRDVRRLRFDNLDFGLNTRSTRLGSPYRPDTNWPARLGSATHVGLSASHGMNRNA